VKPGARKSSIALVTAVAVFSHFVLDIPVHRGDLGLIGNLYKIGFGLYNYPLPAFLLEVACLLGGLWLYLRSTTGTTFLGKYVMILLALLLLLINAFSYWGPSPQNIQEVALFLPTVYLVAALLADWLDGKRSPKGVSVSESVQSAADYHPLDRRPQSRNHSPALRPLGRQLSRDVDSEANPS
jgi:hypothetical protein